MSAAIPIQEKTTTFRKVDREQLINDILRQNEMIDRYAKRMKKENDRQRKSIARERKNIDRERKPIAREHKKLQDAGISKGGVVEKTLPLAEISGKGRRFAQAVSSIFSRQVTATTEPPRVSISRPSDGRRLASRTWEPDSEYRIFPRLSKKPSEPAPDYFKSKEWIWLPSEILIIVAELLPTSSAAAMTICCKLVYTKLGTKFLTQINSDIPPLPVDLYLQPVERSTALTPAQQEREVFLAMLDRDSLSFIYCYYCKKLHDPRNTLRGPKWFEVPNEHRRRCAVAETRPTHHWVHKDFNFSRVQMLMKRHRRGLDCSTELAALSKTCTVHRKGYTRQTTSEAMIRDGKLMMRIQHWVMVPYKEGTQPETPNSFQVDICPHLYTYGKTSFPQEFDYMIACKRSHYLEPDQHCILCSGLRKCDECCTEFQIDSKILPARKDTMDVLGKKNRSMFALVFSVWKDMGDGVTPFSPLWEHHMCPYGPRKGSPWFEKGSIKAGFEEFGFDRQMKKLDWKEFYVNESDEGSYYGESCGH